MYDENGDNLSSKKELSIKEFIKRIRFLSRYELKMHCENSGMTEKEIQGTLMYIYDELSVEEIAEKLNISVSQFYKKKNRLAHRFKSYLKSIKYKDLDLI